MTEVQINLPCNPSMKYEDGGFIQSSQNSDGVKKNFTGIKTLRSFTIKQLNIYDFDEVSSVHYIDEIEVTNIQVIGWVKSTSITSTGSIFEIEDGTGSIQCSFWPNGVYEEEQSGYIEEGNLLKINGSMKIFNKKKSIAVAHISTINNSNFITYHFLNCLYQHLYNTNKLQREEIKVNKNTSLNKLQEDIINCFKNNQDDNGMHINLVVNMLGNKYSENDIKENVEILVRDCHLYNVDEGEYKTSS